MDIRESLVLLREQRKSKKKNPDLELNQIAYRAFSTRGRYAGIPVGDIFRGFKETWDIPDSVVYSVYMQPDRASGAPYGHRSVDGDYVLNQGEGLRFQSHRTTVERIRANFL